MNDLIKKYPTIINKYKPFAYALKQFDFSFRCHRLDKILKYSTFFESILMKNSEFSEITQKLSLRFSNLVGKNFAERKYLFKFFKKFYTQRSKIIHGIEFERETITIEEKKYSLDEFINLSEDLVRQTIFAYLDLINRFDNADQIIDYLDNLALGYSK